MARIIDQFVRKRYQKKRKDVDYKFLKELFKNTLLFMNGRLSKIRSVHIICYTRPWTFSLGESVYPFPVKGRLRAIKFSADTAHLFA